MIRKMGLATLLTGLGSLMLAGMAHATVYNFNCVGVPSDGQFGSYHVVLDTNATNTTFQIVSIVANGGANTPTSDVFRVRMYFYSGQNLTGINLPGVGFTPGNTAGTNPAGTNWGAGLANNGGGGNPHFSNYGEYLNPADNHGVGPNNLLKDGSNTFTQNGAFTLSAASGLAISSGGSFEVQLNDGFAYLADVNVVPEASSLALLLPALVPLGLVLRRRYTRK
jgi:hypothetical protein